MKPKVGDLILITTLFSPGPIIRKIVQIDNDEGAITVVEAESLFWALSPQQYILLDDLTPLERTFYNVELSVKDYT